MLHFSILISSQSQRKDNWCQNNKKFLCKIGSNRWKIQTSTWNTVFCTKQCSEFDYTAMKGLMTSHQITIRSTKTVYIFLAKNLKMITIKLKNLYMLTKISKNITFSYCLTWRVNKKGKSTSWGRFLQLDNILTARQYSGFLTYWGR